MSQESGTVGSGILGPQASVVLMLEMAAELSAAAEPAAGLFAVGDPGAGGVVAVVCTAAASAVVVTCTAAGAVVVI